MIPDYTHDSPDEVRAVFTVIADNKVETVYEREWEPDPKKRKQHRLFSTESDVENEQKSGRNNRRR